MSKDYVSDNLSIPDLSALFPDRVEGDKEAATWPYFRKEIGHAWYVDRRHPQVGFINRDEASVLYSNARLFAGGSGLEIGAWRGWSTCHLLVSGLARLHVIEPLLKDVEWNREFAEAIAAAGDAGRAILVAGSSPDEVIRLGEGGARWSFVFIDGDHEGEAPKIDALTAARFLEPTAMVLFHDLASPHVAAALRALAEAGWKTVIYQTAQIMGAAWRGEVAPVGHRPDPTETWPVPEHLKGFAVAS